MLVEKINEFVDYYEDELRLISKIISAVMLAAYAVIGLLVGENLAEYSYDVGFGAVLLWFLAIPFALFGWAFCFADEEEFSKYKILLSPIVISLFIFVGVAVVVGVIAILYYAVCFLSGIASEIADLITGLIIAS